MTDTIRVLIVEDDFAVAALHRRFLARLDGFSVVGTELTAAAAAAAIESGDVDLVLLDMFLPDASGLDLLRTVRAASAGQLDVIMVTAAPDPELVRQALELGVVDYLLKPFLPDDFTARMRRYADRRHEALALDSADLTQAQIDSMQGRKAQAPRAPLPKGLSENTARLVSETLLATETPVTATALAETLGLSRVSARRYLEHFAAVDLVEVTAKYGDVGRPQNLYRWTGSSGY
jgi:response regulator of citrate/malate metabolism